MKKSTTLIKARLCGLLTILLLFLCGLDVQAQDVTIRSNNGSCLPSTPLGDTDYDIFYKIGGFATWQHEQLSMVLTASDASDKTNNGQLANPANNIFKSGNKIQIGKGLGQHPTCYLSLTLPKGYRFTSYTIVFSKSPETKSGNGESVTFNDDNVETRFGETNSAFDEYVSTTTVATVTSGNSSTITRTSMTDDDMDNVLYFKLDDVTGNGDYRNLITLESAKFYFTSEADYTPMTVPGDVKCVSAIDIPFETSKVDYGTIARRTYDGVTRVSYSSANVKDLTANFTLYEAGSVTAGADFDGVTGNVIEYKEGSISVEDGYYRIGAEDATNPGTDEHVYYIETPSYVLLSDNVTKNPVGYRIVGAKIDYKYGPTNHYYTTNKTYNTFYISYTTTGILGNTYYLNSSGGATTTQSDRAIWFIDEEGYIRTGVSGQTYLTNYNSQSGGSGYAGTTVNKDDAIKFQISNEGYIYYTDGTKNYWLRRTTSWFTTYFRFQDNTGDRASTTTSGTTSVSEFHIDSNPATPYTLKVYDKTGTSAEEVVVNSENVSGSKTLAGLNNDAIKIGVIGTGLIQGTLTLQALDPYIDYMEVVCQDQEEEKEAIRMNQSFTASDFSVNGGEFHFYLPADCVDDNVKITFENLISKYADESYTGGSSENNSRYNFVKSAHYNAFGNSNNNIYTNVNEAINAELERLKVGIVGTTPFKFNNAADLSNQAGILTEYPFSLENYAAAPNNGSFDDMTFTVSEEDQNETRYVFTTDETKYNIGTATARQHRAYAYYQMTVHVQSATYEPQVQFVPIYKDAMYDGENGKTTGDFYGAIITAVDQNDNPGFSSTNEIFSMINRCIEEGRDDFDNTDVPTSPKQLLYLDFSQLAGVYEITTDEHQSMEDYAGTNAPNCLIFIPAGQAAPNDNVAYKTEAPGIFRASQNIVITDKQPFYSPYDIQIDAAKQVKYERKLTSNGKVTKATVLLPFIITVDANGQHTNEGDTEPTFSLHQMQAENCLSDENVDNPGETCVFFPNITPVGTTTQANKPYLVNVLNAPADDNLSFVVTQKGSTIKATTGMDATNYTFPGETASGTSAVGVESATNYNFTAYATYSGRMIPRTSGTYFYFAKNNFRNSDYLSDKFTTVDMYPFRAYYVVNSNNGVKGMSSMNVLLEEGEGNPEATSIKTVKSGVAVVGGKGTLTITSASDQNVLITSISGVNVHNMKMNGGDSQTIAVPSGVYIVNGTKVVVK